MQRKDPLRGKILARCIPERRFAGHFGYMARISCHSQLILNTRRQYAATNWRFSRPRPLSGCMERKTCHGLPPENAPRRNLATDRRSGTHRARILPLPVRPRAHQGAIPPPSDAGERISRAFCHRRAPRNASRENIATTSRPRAHSRRSCHGRTPGFAPHQITAALPAKKRRRRQDLENAPLSEVRKTECWRGWDEQRGYGAVQRHRRTLGNAARRNIAMADNAPRDKRRRAFCSPSFAVLFTARVAIGAFAVGSRRHLAASLIETHIR